MLESWPPTGRPKQPTATQDRSVRSKVRRCNSPVVAILHDNSFCGGNVVAMTCSSLLPALQFRSRKTLLFPDLDPNRRSPSRRKSHLLDLA